jgi:hypothetical protein
LASAQTLRCRSPPREAGKRSTEQTQYHESFWRTRLAARAGRDIDHSVRIRPRETADEPPAVFDHHVHRASLPIALDPYANPNAPMLGVVIPE